jgi:cytochrome c oxidase cbb3-type subunit 2
LEHAFAGVLPACVYAAAVSFYSTALVGFALVRSRGLSPVLLAAGVFGVSGWVGSAMGIGMVNDLGRLPLGFWAVAVVFLVLGIFLTERKVAQGG